MTRPVITLKREGRKWRGTLTLEGRQLTATGPKREVVRYLAKLFKGAYEVKS